MVPTGIKVTIAINILYCLIAIILVSVASFNDDWFSNAIDSINPDEAKRRDNIEISTVSFLGISIVLSILFLIFYDKTINYYLIFMLAFIVLVFVFVALTALQFYYDDKKDLIDDSKYDFTKWWPLVAIITNLMIVFFIFRNRRKI